MRKTVIVGVTGGIAAYKTCEVVSMLRKLNFDVRVIMSKNATEFVTPLTLETLSAERVVVDMFDKNRGFDVEHISYAKLADAFLIAPASANIIAKLANGIADDMLTTTVMATKSPVIICPAMNTNMLENEATLKNIDTLKQRGFLFIESEKGYLACGDEGKGRMAEPQKIVAFIENLLTPNNDLKGKTVLITAGATREPIDFVRFISNRSSGKMGMALADAAMERGARVILIAGFVSVELSKGAKIIRVETTEDMYKAVMESLAESDIIIKAAAPSDYKVKSYFDGKIKDKALSLELEKNIDIAKEVGSAKKDKRLVIFAAETNDLLQNAMGKLKDKNADLIVANDVKMEGAGFDSDTNIATLIHKDGRIEAYEKMSKYALANIILDAINSK